jgi:hypothetical protein
MQVDCLMRCILCLEGTVRHESDRLQFIFSIDRRSFRASKAQTTRYRCRDLGHDPMIIGHDPMIIGHDPMINPHSECIAVDSYSTQQSQGLTETDHLLVRTSISCPYLDRTACSAKPRPVRQVLRSPIEETEVAAVSSTGFYDPGFMNR